MTKEQEKVYNRLLENPPPRFGCVLYEAYWMGRYCVKPTRWEKSSLAWAAWKAGYDRRSSIRATRKWLRKEVNRPVKGAESPANFLEV